MNTQTFPCTRCDGSGRIRAFGHVLGGVCFKCNGSGKQARKPSKPSQLFPLSAIDRETGVRGHVYNVRARTPAEALRKAKAMAARSTGYLAESVELMSQH